MPSGLMEPSWREVGVKGKEFKEELDLEAYGTVLLTLVPTVAK